MGCQSLDLVLLCAVQINCFQKISFAANAKLDFGAVYLRICIFGGSKYLQSWKFMCADFAHKFFSILGNKKIFSHHWNGLFDGILCLASCYLHVIMNKVFAMALTILARDSISLLSGFSELFLYLVTFEGYHFRNVYSFNVLRKS